MRDTDSHRAPATTGHPWTLSRRSKGGEEYRSQRDPPQESLRKGQVWAREFKGSASKESSSLKGS